MLTNLRLFLKSKQEIESKQYTLFREQHFHYNEIKLNNILRTNINNNRNINIMLDGYFQSYKYFENYKETIYRLIRLDNIKDSVRQKLNIRNYKNSISIHFRFGDYLKCTYNHNILDINYYRSALFYLLFEIDHYNKLNNRVNSRTRSNSNLNYNEDNKVDEDNKEQTIIDDDVIIIYRVYYFCENDDLNMVLPIIENLQNTFPYLIFERANPELSDWEQMIFMSLCNHNIIANSTFSWWGAYLNNNEDKKICYPSQWFGPSLSHYNLTDLFPSHWIRID
jgi:uncharacterized membrane protein